MFKKQLVRRSAAACAMAFATAVFSSVSVQAYAQRVIVARASAVANVAAAAPVSAPADVVVVLHGSDTQQAALRSLLIDQMTPGSASYHQWLTPAQFADRFQPSASDAEAVRQYFVQQGIAVDAASASRTSLQLHGTVQQFQRAFATQIAAAQTPSTTLRNATSDLTLPASIAPLVGGVEGLSESTLSPAASSALQSFAAAVEANTQPVLTISSAEACSASEATSLRDAFTPSLQQAAAQGITVLASGPCVTQALAPATGLVTAVHLNSEPLEAAVSLAADGSDRPGWQVASGLPDSSLRAVPDVSVDGDLKTLAAAFRTIVAKAGTRQGSANAELYALAATKGIYSHADASLGTWQAGTGLGTVSIQDLIDAWPNGSSSSAASLSSDNYSPTHGVSFTLTAIVTGIGQNAVPTGTVTFQSSQGATVGTAALQAAGGNTARASYTVTNLNGGTYTFTAQYAGDANFAAASSSASPAIVTITPEASSLSASTGAATVGGNIPVSVTVSSASGVGTPTGTVTVVPQGTTSTTSYSGTLASTTAGKATALVSVPATQAGTLALQVNCGSPNSSFSCNSPISVQASVDKGTPSVALAFTPTSQTNTGSGTLKATLTGVNGSAIPTGSVDFFDGATNIGTGKIASGVATLAASVTGAIPHAVTAVYAGDSNYATATSNAVSLAGALVSTTTSLTASNYAPAFGQSITLTSNVTPASTVTGATPSGTITFASSLQGNVGSVAYTGTSVSLPITVLQVGTHTLTATYSGDTAYAGSTSTSSVVVTVSQATGTLAATIAPTTAIGYGTTASISATVTLTTGGAPSGSVTATIAGVNGATYTAALVPATSSSTATMTIPSPPPGTYTVTVACTTNTNFGCSNTVALPLKVVKGQTATTLAITPTSPQAGTKVSLSATVAPATVATVGTFTVPSGTITFFDGAVSLGTATLANGVATINVALNGKTHTITATYSGDVNWSGSTSTGQAITPSPLDPTVNLSSNTLAPLAGANVILTATVTAPNNVTLIPSGTISFYDVVNGTQKLLGTATLISNGLDGATAAISTTGLTGGTHNVYAIYAGDVSFNSSRSASLSIAAADFTLTMVPNTLIMNRGTAAVATGLVTLQGGFTGSVTLGCQPPAGAATTCSFTPSTVTGGGNTTLNIITTTASRSTAPVLPGRSAPAGIALAAILCGAIFRRRLSRTLLIVLVSFVMLSGLGCADGALSGDSNGSGSGGSGSTGGTPLGTLVFTLTAAASDNSTTVRHQYYYQVTVQ